MSQKRDYYEVLGIDRSASDGEIKAAYRKSALQYHPDRNPGDSDAEARFKEASEAYEVLSDAHKRATYDRFGHSGLQGQGFEGFQDVGDIFSSFGSIFEEFFGLSGGPFGGRGGARSRRGADLRYDLAIDFETVIFGDETAIEYDRTISCNDCSGSGAAPGGRKSCDTCGGVGQVRRTQGFFSVQTTCPGCRGSGQMIVKKCAGCGGRGQIEERRNISVKIPPGVDTGLRLRVGGEGEGGAQGGSPGDLYVVIHVKEDERYRREENDLVFNHTIGIAQAALGVKLKLETLEGEIDVDVPAGTQHGDRVTIAGAGIPRLRGSGRGDLHIEFNVQVPKKLNREQREILQQFAAAGGEQVGGSGGLFNKIFGD